MTRNVSRLPVLAATAVATLLLVAPPALAGEGWDPASFAQEDTLEFFTVNPDGEEHWAMVWFVLIDGAPHVRLGERAETRMTGNVHHPKVRVRVGGETYDDIVATELPDLNDEVAEAMADKYWTAFLMPYMPERYTARLGPGPEPAAPGDQVD